MVAGRGRRQRGSCWPWSLLRLSEPSSPKRGPLDRVASRFEEQTAAYAGALASSLNAPQDGHRTPESSTTLSIG